MRADPRVGTPSYLQGWAPAIDFADRAKVLRTGGRTCVPVRCYGDVLLIDEWNPDEPGAHQRKFYAPGVGNVCVGAGGESRRSRCSSWGSGGSAPGARLGPPSGARARAARLPGAPGRVRPHPAGAAGARRGATMTRSIIASSLKFRVLVVLVAAAVMVVGVLQLRKAPVDVLPEFTPPYVEVQTEALGLSADEVEQLHHGPARAGPAQRRRPGSTISLGVGPRPVVDRADLRARHRHPATPARSCTSG